MAGWGSAPWGTSPWGTGTVEEAVVDVLANVQSISVLAADLIQINFSQNMKNNSVLQNPSSYVLVPFSDGIAVNIRSVRTGKSVGTDSVLLVITPPTPGDVYDLTIVGDVRSLSNTALDVATGRFTARRTKIDSLLSTRPIAYDLRPESIFRNILNAIGREDDRIGGSQDEGEEIVR